MHGAEWELKVIGDPATDQMVPLHSADSPAPQHPQRCPACPHAWHGAYTCGWYAGPPAAELPCQCCGTAAAPTAEVRAALGLPAEPPTGGWTVETRMADIEPPAGG